MGGFRDAGADGVCGGFRDAGDDDLGGARGEYAMNVSGVGVADADDAHGEWIGDDADASRERLESSSALPLLSVSLNIVEL